MTIIKTRKQMLADFIDDTSPGMPKPDKAKAVANMDISVVSEQYDKEIRNAVRNVFSGAFACVGGVPTRSRDWLRECCVIKSIN
jgi:hypothetical protein